MRLWQILYILLEIFSLIKLYDFTRQACRWMENRPEFLPKAVLILSLFKILWIQVKYQTASWNSLWLIEKKTLLSLDAFCGHFATCSGIWFPLFCFNFSKKLQPQWLYKITLRDEFGTLPNIKMERFTEIVNGFYTLTIFAKNSIINNWLSLKYAFDSHCWLKINLLYRV